MSRVVAMALAVTGVLVVGACGAHAFDVCGPTDDPCVIASDLHVPDGSEIDVGPRALVIAAGRTVTVDGYGEIAIFAGSFTMETGARLLALGVGGEGAYGGDVLVDTGWPSGDGVTLEPGSLIDVSRGWGGDIVISSTFGDVLLEGELRANATTRDGDGGLVQVQTYGGYDLIMAGSIAANGGDRYSAGGFVGLYTRDVIVRGTITARGGEYDSGAIDIEADRDLRIEAGGVLDIASLQANEGGYVYAEALGAIVIDGSVVAQGSGTGGGYGGAVYLGAWGPITLNGPIDVSASSSFAEGGLVVVDSFFGDVAVRGPISADGSFDEYGRGGEFDLWSGGTIALEGGMTLQGERAGFFWADGQGRIDITGTVDVSGQRYPGTLYVRGCDLDIASGAVLRHRVVEYAGYGGQVQAVARGATSVAGTVEADFVEFTYRSDPPAFAPTANVSPAPVLTEAPYLSCCHCGPACGNAFRDPGEACDDGNTAAGDCCAADCSFEAVGTTCDDQSACTSGEQCDGAGSCRGDAISCALCDTCDPAIGCVTAPQPDCGFSLDDTGARLLLTDSASDDADAVTWKWTKGVLTPRGHFGDPLTADHYALCLYDGTGALRLRAGANAGGTCGTRACWRDNGGRGFAYRNAATSADGVLKIALRPGPAGSAKITVKGAGANLPMPALGLPLPVTAQLQATNGRCWGAAFDAPLVTRNDGGGFAGRGGGPLD